MPSSDQHSAAMRRPALLAGLVLVRRDDGSVQVGVDAPHAFVLDGLAPGAASVLDALDGTRTRAELDELGGQVELAPAELDALLDALLGHRVLVDAAAGAATGWSERARVTMAPDLAAAGLRDGAGRGTDAIERRGAAWVEVRGAGRVGAAVAALLAASGIGRVSVRDPRRAGYADQSPAGLQLETEGPSRELAARERVRSLGLGTHTSRRPFPATADLVVLAPDAGPTTALASTWSRRSTPHLLVFVRETVGVVGPLVRPGSTCCLACLELHRRDRDPQWPRVAAQLTDSRAGAACDVTLATVVAGQAAMHAVAFIDHARPLSDATLETELATGVTRRRTWTPHPACGCRWAQLADADAR